jgi:hypothetical protein
VYKETLKYRNFIINFVEKLVEDNQQRLQRQDPSTAKTYLDHVDNFKHTMEYVEHIEGIAMFLLASFDTTGKGCNES